MKIRQLKKRAVMKLHWNRERVIHLTWTEVVPNRTIVAMRDWVEYLRNQQTSTV